MIDDKCDDGGTLTQSGAAAREGTGEVKSHRFALTE